MSTGFEEASRRVSTRHAESVRHFGILVALTVLALVILGYHPGLEDDAFYLAAIKQRLNPALFPHDADFFRLQFQATLFDRLIAGSVRLTHIPLEWAVLLWQFAAVLAILAACWRIARQWAGVALVAALLSIPVAGTGISLVDQHLHPRALATAGVLWAVAMTLERRFVLAGLLLAGAASVHAIMASFGVSCCLFLALPRGVPGVALLLPLGWVFDPATEAWRRAAATRSFYFPLRWEWYEWVGVLAPVALLWLFGRFGRRLAWFAIFQFVVAMATMLPTGLERLRPLEPMRYLQLVYLLMFLLLGGLIGKSVWRWLVVFVPLCAVMTYAQVRMYPASPHIECPGKATENRWVKAFVWVRGNTPVDSYFALDPEYMALPGEDFHGFRALAERSALADNLKDPGMAARVPRLAGRWAAESDAQRGWRNFQAADFERLKAEFGVDWVVVNRPSVSGLACSYLDGDLRVCRVE